MSGLRVAVVGAGHLGTIHARLLRQVPNTELVAITDPSPERREAVAKEFGVTTYASHQQIVGVADAAIVAAPTFLHFEIARDLLFAGIDLMIEKPLTNDADTAETLVRMAASKRRTLQVGHIERFNPAWTETVGRVGRVKYVEAVRASSFPGRCLDCGVILDLMIHDLDLVLSLTDAPISRIDASGMAVVTDQEDIAEARITFADGLVANLKASRISPTPARRMQLFGSHGFAELDFSKPSAEFIVPHELLLHRDFELGKTASVTDFRKDLFDRWLKRETLAIEPRNALLDELHDFAVACSTGIQPLVTGEAGARAVRVADQIRQAIDERQWTFPHLSETLGAIGPFALPQDDFAATRRRAA